LGTKVPAEINVRRIAAGSAGPVRRQELVFVVARIRQGRPGNENGTDGTVDRKSPDLVRIDSNANAPYSFDHGFAMAFPLVLHGLFQFHKGRVVVMDAIAQEVKQLACMGTGNFNCREIRKAQACSCPSGLCIACDGIMIRQGHSLHARSGALRYDFRRCILSVHTVRRMHMQIQPRCQ